MSFVFYRVGQFWRGLRARITPEDQRRVVSILPSAAVPLFTKMPIDAQRHSLNVLGSLEAAGQHHPDLAIAALLHDCGKVAAAQGGVALGLWLRGPLVLLDRFWPGLTARWASPTSVPGSLSNSGPEAPKLNAPKLNVVQGWRYALYVQREHPAIGAAWAAEAGCSTLSCWLIAEHQTPLNEAQGSDDERGLLMALQQADNGN
jgi:hypothetical protein